MAVLLFTISLSSFSQQKEVIYSEGVEDPWKVKHIGGVITATNNGISLLPSFTLNKPALRFELTMGNKKMIFDPMLRFSMEGKPWAFIFWWRYKVVKMPKFTFNVGAHPALIFRNSPMMVNGISRDVITAQRYLAAEVVPNYWITKNTSVGIYYLHSGGLEPGTIKSTNFITLNANFNYIPVSEQLFFRFNPQVFYLKMDTRDGYYITSTLTLAKKQSPWALQSIVNQALRTNIITKSDFIWNVSLIYSFRSEFRKP
ncbi:MAG: hypothetical protein ACKORJ_03405 [Bacteroidota bacterium]